MKIVQQISRAKFKVTTPETETELELDFNPVIELLSDRERLRGYKLIHWQGKPKGYRQWGIYDSLSDNYTCNVWQDLPVFYGASRLVMLDDQTAATIPSAVIYHVGSLKV